MSEIFLAHDNEPAGPFRIEDVREMVRKGSMEADVPAWTQGMDEWRPLREVFPDAIPRGPPAPSIADQEPDNEAGFFKAVLQSFVYPVRGDGLIILIIGTVFLVISDFLAWVPIAGWIVGGLVSVYFVAYLVDVIKETAIGENQLPQFPAIDDIVRPFGYFLLAFFVYLAPAWGYWIFAGGIDGRHEPAVLNLLLLSGLFCIPMALLRAAVFNNAWDMLNVFALLSSITRIFLPYLLIGALLTGSFFLAERYDPTSGSLPLYVSYPLATLVFLYFSVLQARLIGVLYLTRKEQLGWFE